MSVRVFSSENLVKITKKDMVEITKKYNVKSISCVFPLFAYDPLPSFALFIYTVSLDSMEDAEKPLTGLLESDFNRSRCIDCTNTLLHSLVFHCTSPSSLH